MTGVSTYAEAETQREGERLGRTLCPGDVVALLGDLGSGKTCFVAGACRALGVRSGVTSPTFTLINEYPAPFGMVVHADLYRIRDRAELAELGLEEYFVARCICFIEWAEPVMDLLPAGHIVVRLEHGRTHGERRIHISRGGQ